MNDKYIQTNLQGLVIDPNSGAVLNVDNGALEAYRRQKAILEVSKSTTQRIEQLENDIGDIKEMLQQLLKR
jgi:tetrahydromethanopterin S-methyltransferase subunit B